jgi:sugar phosphate permease
LQNKNISPIIVAFSTLAINYGTRGSFGLFLKPLEGEFETSRAVISSILSITMLTYSALAFFTGYLIDRVGIFFIFIARSSLVLALGSIIVGTAYSSYVPILPSVTRTLFGRDFFGRVWGLNGVKYRGSPGKLVRGLPS